MSRTVVIEPVSRVEGHARISLQLDAQGHLVDARFQVLEFRGFERFCQGRPFSEMAGITARICGICPVSHLLAAARTGDRLLAVSVPPAARKLRRLLNLAQICQSHALSFFYLSSPDWLLGWDSDPAQRNLLGLMAADPPLARAGIRLRQFGQAIIEQLAGRRIHSAWVVPGGVQTPLGAETRDWILERLPEARRTIALALERFKALLEGPLAEAESSFGHFPSLFLALGGDDDRWEHLEGPGLRVGDAEGRRLVDNASEDGYAELLGEAVEPWTYLKFPYFRPWGYPEGVLRVGPLARLNLCERIGTPWADAELAALRRRCGRMVTSSFAYHQARLVEIVACLEGIELLVRDPELMDPQVRAHAGLNRREAVGVSEAPRGTLFHHYRVDEHGLITAANLVIATGLNNLAMNRTVLQIARAVLPDPLPPDATIPEPLLNRVEAGIRCFDPCLSCATHAAGTMPLLLELRRHDGTLQAMRRRD